MDKTMFWLRRGAIYLYFGYIIIVVFTDISVFTGGLSLADISVIIFATVFVAFIHLAIIIIAAVIRELWLEVIDRAVKTIAGEVNKEITAAIIKGINQAVKQPKKTPQTWWQILGVRQTATMEEIKRQYHFMAARVHPDRANGSKEDMIRLNEAYEQAKANFAGAKR